MDIVGACLLDGFPTDNKLSLKTSKSAAKGESRATPTRGRSTVYTVSTMLPALGVLRTRICGSRNYLARNASETESEQVFCFC